MSTRITRLRRQGEQLHSSLREFLDQAEGEHPELTLHVDRLAEQVDALLAQIKHASAELDQIEKAGAEEFVSNYIVGPGSK